MGGGRSSNFESLGFLVPIWGFWVSGTDLGDFGFLVLIWVVVRVM